MKIYVNLLCFIKTITLSILVAGCSPTPTEQSTEPIDEDKVFYLNKKLLDAFENCNNLPMHLLAFEINDSYTNIQVALTDSPLADNSSLHFDRKHSLFTDISTSEWFAHCKNFNLPIALYIAPTDTSRMFAGATAFNQPIGHWIVNSVENMESMFAGATAFNQPIGHWDVSYVENMEGMFAGATTFNQDLSGWCVSNIKEKPKDFDTNTPAWEERYKPIWGTCPS